MKHALLFAPFLAFFAGVSASYGVFAPNAVVLFGFIGVIPLGICVGLVASGLGEHDRAAEQNARMRDKFTLLMNRPEIIGASINGLRDFARAALEHQQKGEGL